MRFLVFTLILTSKNAVKFNLRRFKNVSGLQEGFVVTFRKKKVGG